MPTLRNFGGFRITMYFEDHNPPHFHIVSPTQQAVVEIETLSVLTGKMEPSRLRVALDWAKKNKTLLKTRWSELHTND